MDLDRHIVEYSLGALDDRCSPKEPDRQVVQGDSGGADTKAAPGTERSGAGDAGCDSGSDSSVGHNEPPNKSVGVFLDVCVVGGGNLRARVQVETGDVGDLD